MMLGGFLGPRSSRPRRRRLESFSLELLEGRRLLSSGTTTLRVVTYNIDADIYSQGLIAPPEPDFETVLEGIGAESVAGDAQPIDILAMEETSSNIQTVVPIVNALNAHYGAGTYAYSTYQALSTGATDGNGPNALIYNTKTLTLVSTVGIGQPDPGGPPRQPVRYEFRPVGGSAADDFYVYVDHFKSGDQTLDNNGTRRQVEGEEIRADAATLPADSRILYVGDYNSFYPTDPGYAAVTAPGPDQGFDPINQPVFRGGPRATLTDRSNLLTTRLDFELTTQNVLNDPNGLYLVPGSYHVFGNDGSASDVSQSTTALSGLPNRTAVLDALVASSDHLPVVADYTDTVTPPVGPAIGSLSVDPASVASGANVTLSANGVIEQGGSGTVTSVAFYRESNGVDGLQVGSDSLVGYGTQNGSSWTLSTSTSGLGGGVYTYYAQAQDDSSRLSDPVSTTLNVSGPATPTISSLTVSPTSVAAGTSVLLEASNVSKLGGTITNVEFYRDTNGLPGLQVGSDVKLGNGTEGGSNWVFDVSTFGLPAGTQTFYAVATDSTGTRSATAAVNLTVISPQPPTIGSFTVSPTSASSGSSVTLQASSVLATGASVADVSFYLESDGVAGYQPESDTFVADGVRNGNTWTASISTAGLPAGNYTYYAVATDSNDQVSAASSTSLTVTPPSQPLVNLQILASASPNGPFTSSLEVSPSETVYYEIVGQVAPVGTVNGSHTITSLTTADGLNSLSFNLLDPASSTLPVSLTSSILASPSTSPAASASWDGGLSASAGTVQSAGGGTNNQLTGVRPIHSPGVFSGALAPDVILVGSFTVASALPSGATAQIIGSYGGTSGGLKINNGTSALIINSTTESGSSPLVSYAPLTLTVATLPSWLAPGSAVAWDATTHTLNVTGTATIVADPGTDAPNIVANGSAAHLTIAPTTVGFVNLGGVTLTNGATITVPSVGSARTHTNHNVVVIDSTGAAPTFSIDSTSKFDLVDNDLVIQNGNLATIQAELNEGRNLTGGGNWTGNGLTSSASSSLYASNGYEYTTLGMSLNSALPNGAFTSWQAGSSTLALGANDIIIKYTYNGDFTLDGQVNADDETVFGLYFDNGATTNHTFVQGDTNGDGKVDANDETIFSLNYGLGTHGDQL